MEFKRRASSGLQALPVELGRDADIAAVRRFGVLVGHLAKDQIRELLQIVTVAYPVVAQGSAEAPDFGDNGGGAYARVSRVPI